MICNFVKKVSETQNLYFWQAILLIKSSAGTYLRNLYHFDVLYQFYIIFKLVINYILYSSCDTKLVKDYKQVNSKLLRSTHIKCQHQCQRGLLNFIHEASAASLENSFNILTLGILLRLGVGRPVITTPFLSLACFLSNKLNYVEE